MSKEDCSDLRKDRRALLSALVEMVKEAELTSLDYVDGDLSIKLSKAPLSVQQMTTLPSQEAVFSAPSPVSSTTAPPNSANAAHEKSASETENAVRSPMVGTAYLRPSPEAEPFIKVGDRVTEGQTLMIIEAMKVMNSLGSPRAGTIKAILVEDAEPVEFDQDLIIIE